MSHGDRYLWGFTGKSKCLFMKYGDHRLHLKFCQPHHLKEGNEDIVLKGRRDGHRPCRKGSRLSASALWEPAAERESRPCAPSPPARPPGATQWSAGRLLPWGRNTGHSQSAVVISLEKGGWPIFSPDKQPNRVQAGQMPYPDPNYALLPDLLQSEDLIHFRPWVKILLKSQVPVRSHLKGWTGKGRLPNATGLTGCINTATPSSGSRNGMKSHWRTTGCRGSWETPFEQTFPLLNVYARCWVFCVLIGNWNLNLVNISVNKVREKKN